MDTFDITFTSFNAHKLHVMFIARMKICGTVLMCKYWLMNAGEQFCSQGIVGMEYAQRCHIFIPGEKIMKRNIKNIAGSTVEKEWKGLGRDENHRAHKEWKRSRRSEQLREHKEWKSPRGAKKLRAQEAGMLASTTCRRTNGNDEREACLHGTEGHEKSVTFSGRLNWNDILLPVEVRIIGLGLVVTLVECAKVESLAGLEDNMDAYQLYNKRTLHYARMVGRVETTPDTDIRLAFADSLGHPVCYEQARKFLRRFAMQLRRWYPACWWVWKIEMSAQGALQIHLVGSFGKVLSPKELNRCGHHWQNVIGQYDKRLFDRSPCDRFHLSRLFAPRKLPQEVTFIKENPGKCTLGIINHQRVKFTTPRVAAKLASELKLEMQRFTAKISSDDFADVGFYWFASRVSLSQLLWMPLDDIARIPELLPYFKPKP